MQPHNKLYSTRLETQIYYCDIEHATYHADGDETCWHCDAPLTSNLDLDCIYAALPLTEKTLLKHYKSYGFRIANDQGYPCDWYIYENGAPIAVVIYYKGRKTAMHGIAKWNGQAISTQLAG